MALGPRAEQSRAMSSAPREPAFGVAAVGVIGGKKLLLAITGVGVL